MKPLKIISQNPLMETKSLSPCHLTEDKINVPQFRREVTEEWLERKVESLDLKFKYFITLSFNKAQRRTLNQYLQNKHINNVIHSYFYSQGKPRNPLRVWFFLEKHKSAKLHLHILCEGLNPLDWLLENNRKITIRQVNTFYKKIQEICHSNQKNNYYLVVFYKTLLNTYLYHNTRL